MPPQMPIPPHLRGRPFLLAEALAAGLSTQMLRGQRFRRMRKEVYVEAGVPDDLETRVDAARLVLRADIVLSHHTAAQLRGLPVPRCEQIHVTMSPKVERTRAAGVTPHRSPVHSVDFKGRRLSTPTENFLELAQTLSLVDLVVLGDAMVRRGFVTCDQLVDAVDRTQRRRGRRLARRAARLVRAEVDSPMESRLRLLVVLSGLPEPQPNFVVHDEVHGWIGPVDLAYPEFRIAIEYHGDIHRRKRGAWRSDIAKAELLRAVGWTVIILTSTDLEDRPQRALDRIHHALAEAHHPSVPAELNPAWRSHLLPKWATDRVEWARADRAS